MHTFAFSLTTEFKGFIRANYTEFRSKRIFFNLATLGKVNASTKPFYLSSFIIHQFILFYYAKATIPH